MAAIGQLLAGYLVVVAMLAGSFINLAADRIPRGESIVHPRSHCRTCGRTLNTVDLLPVVGWMLRGGRCATCRIPIGVSPPIVEAACGLIMLVGIVRLGVWPGAAAGVAAVAVFGIAVTGGSLAARRLAR